MRQEDNRQPMGSESLGTLVSSWRDGTFSEIWADWKWIWGYTKRYRRAVWFYTILGVASSTLGLVSAVASKYSIDIITGYDSDHLWFIVTVMVASALVGLLLRSVTSRISTKISLRRPAQPPVHRRGLRILQRHPLAAGPDRHGVHLRRHPGGDPAL